MELRELEPVGNYALKLGWGDGHSGGLYTFGYLRTLCDLVDEHGERLLDVKPPLTKF